MQPPPMQGLAFEPHYGNPVSASPGVATASRHNTMSSENTIYITGVSPGTTTVTQTIELPTGIQNPYPQYETIIYTFNVTVKACPKPKGPAIKTPTPAPVKRVVVKPTDPPVNDDPHFAPATPQPQNGTGTETGWYVPPAAGPDGQIVLTYLSQNGSRQTDYYVAAVDNQGHKTFWRGITDAAGHAHLRVPQIAGGIASLLVFKNFDKDSNPDAGGSCHIGSAAQHIDQTQPIPAVKLTNGPLNVTEAGSAYERDGFNQGVFQLHIRGIDPEDVRVLVDGNPQQADVVAASDQSLVVHLHDDVALGRHTFAVESSGFRSNEYPADIVALRIEPVPPSEPGVTQMIGVDVSGLPPGDAGMADFEVGGASVLSSGGTRGNARVANGRFEIPVVGVRSGQGFLRVHLRVSISGFWSL